MFASLDLAPSIVLLRWHLFLSSNKPSGLTPSHKTLILLYTLFSLHLKVSVTSPDIHSTQNEAAPNFDFGDRFQGVFTLSNLKTEHGMGWRCSQE
jgi:hypothetical protein